MAGLVPAIHALQQKKEDVDARHKVCTRAGEAGPEAGHDD
jgi:hypothetical protein